jgi:hypothetical protein
MDPFTEARFIIGKQIQAERRAEAAANRLVTDSHRRTAREGAGEGTGWFDRMATPFRVNNRAAQT